MNIKVIKSETASTTPISRLGAYKINATAPIVVKANNVVTTASNFKVGSVVRHLEEGLIGKVSFVGSDKLSIVWKDNTRERMTIAEATESLEYVDDTQTQVAPLTPQMSDKKEQEEEDLGKDTHNEAIEDALAALDTEELDSGDVIDMDIDMEKITMQHKMAKMEKKLMSKQDDAMKTKIATELVDLAVSKGMTEEDNADMEIIRITMLNDKEFAAYRQSVLDYEDDGSEITLANDNDPVDETMTPQEREAKKLLKSLRGGSRGGVASSYSSVDSDGETRNIGGAKQEKLTFSNHKTPQPTFEQQFTSILASAVDDIDEQPMRRTAAPRMQQKSELPGFENLQGPTKPLMPGGGKTAAYQSPANSSLKDLFSNMNWTTVSKIH